jgi:spermidine synthase
MPAAIRSEPKKSAPTSALRRRDWKVRGAIMSTWHPTRLLTGYGWDAITAACLLGAQPPRTLLMLGLGGATVARQILHLLPELTITAIDLDPRALEEAPRNLGPAADRVTMIHADAYAWLDLTKSKFDAVIDDLYASGPTDVFRPIPVNEALLRRLKARTHTHGVVVANFVLGPGHRRVLSDARAAFRSGFAQWRSLRPPLGANSILVGGASLQSAGALKAYREKWAPRERRLWGAIRTGR